MPKYRKSATPSLRASNSRYKRKVWLYMVDGHNNDDLAILDAQGFDTWRGNPETKAGDLVLMYRTAPYSDIAYVFVALGDAHKTRPSRFWPWKDAVDLGDGFRLRRVIKLDELKKDPSLKGWDFLINQRGATSRKADLREQGVWRGLRNMLQSRDPDLRRYLKRWTSDRGRGVFLSYASPDRRRAKEIYSALSRNGLDVWLDHNELTVGEKYNVTIQEKIKSSKAFVVCLSNDWLKRDYAQKELQWALERARERDNFLFPVQIRNCTIPDALRDVIHIATLTGRNKDLELDKLSRLLRKTL
jgi:TIR domain-containing protein